MCRAPKGSKRRPEIVEARNRRIIFGGDRPKRVALDAKHPQADVESRFRELKVSRRISPRKTLVVIEEKGFMNFNHEDASIAAKRVNQRLLGPSDVADWLGVSAGWVRDHATRKEPRIRAIKVGKLIRFRPEDVEEFLRDSMENVA
jgi:excisionase family DNA binding protein